MQQELLAIRQSIRDQQCIVFLGSGLSHAAGLPSASDLERLLSEKLVPPPSQSSLQEAAEAYARAFTPIRLKIFIRDLIAAQTEERLIDRSIHSLLARLPRIDFITTNWDSLLENSFSATSINVISCDEGVPYWTPGKRNILKMHGCVTSPHTMVVTTREYDEFISKKRNIVSKVGSLLRENTLVICGYSLLDSTFRQIFLDVLGGQRQPPHNVFWVEPFQTDAIADDWRKYGVRRLQITARDFFDSLVEQLDEPDPRHRPSSAQQVFVLLRKAKEIANAFGVIVTEEVDDFEFFRSKIARLSLISERLTSLGGSLLSDLSKDELQKALAGARWLHNLPIELEDLLRHNKKRVSVSNPESVVLLLAELVTTSTQPLATWMAEVEKRLRAAEGSPFPKEEPPQVSSALRTSIGRARTARGLRRFAGVMDLLRSRRGELRALLESPETEDLVTEALSSLWASFDLLLLEEYFGSHSGGFELLKAFLSHNGNDQVRKGILVLGQLGRETSFHLDPAKVMDRFHEADFEERDLKIALRCLALHFYDDEIRRLSVFKLEWPSLWRLVVFDLLPMKTLHQVAERVFAEPSIDYPKILFDLKVDDLRDSTQQRLSCEDERTIQDLLVRFGESRIILEDGYYHRFAEAVRAVGAAQAENLSDTFSELLNTMQEEVPELARAVPPSQPVVDELPEAAKERLGKNPLYLRYLIREQNDELALSAFDSITDSSMAVSVLRIGAINSALLRKIAATKKLMLSYPAKRALAFNPKSTTAIAGRFVRELRPNDLDLLARSRDIDGGIRAMAKQLLTTRGIRPRPPI